MSGNLDPNRSPMTAPVTVRAAGSGVRRLNNVPLMIVFAVAVIVGGAKPPYGGAADRAVPGRRIQAISSSTAINRPSRAPSACRCAGIIVASSGSMTARPQTTSAPWRSAARLR